MWISHIGCLLNRFLFSSLVNAHQFRNRFFTLFKEVFYVERAVFLYGVIAKPVTLRIYVMNLGNRVLSTPGHFQSDLLGDAQHVGNLLTEVVASIANVLS